VKRSRVRVVAGSARGIHLSTPDGSEVRPTTQRTREAVFNALNSMGAVVDANVLDLFAGSGAMGIEALSRGAAAATFVDSSPSAITAVRDNLEVTRLADRATVHRGDWSTFIDSEYTTFDLAILDPPYRFDAWPDLLERIRARVIVVESSQEVDLPPGWSGVRQRSYGATVVAIATAGAGN
jgi:16S rRNA (guanine966-N2)-methyltransferase